MRASQTANDTRTILEKVPESRDNYNVLMYSLFQYWGVKFTDEQKAQMAKCPSVEGISRAARKVWNQGEFLPSKTIQKRRRRNEGYVREIAKYRWEFDMFNNVARKVRV